MNARVCAHPWTKRHAREYMLVHAYVCTCVHVCTCMCTPLCVLGVCIHFRMCEPVCVCSCLCARTCELFIFSRAQSTGSWRSDVAAEVDAKTGPGRAAGLGLAPPDTHALWAQQSQGRGRDAPRTKLPATLAGSLAYFSTSPTRGHLAVCSGSKPDPRSSCCPSWGSSVFPLLVPTSSRPASGGPLPQALRDFFLRPRRRANSVGFSIGCFGGSKGRIVTACGKGQPFCGTKDIFFPSLIRALGSDGLPGSSEAVSGRRLGRRCGWPAGQGACCPHSASRGACSTPGVPPTAHLRVARRSRPLLALCRRPDAPAPLVRPPRRPPRPLRLRPLAPGSTLRSPSPPLHWAASDPALAPWTPQGAVLTGLPPARTSLLSCPPGVPLRNPQVAPMHDTPPGSPSWPTAPPAGQSVQARRRDRAAHPAPAAPPNPSPAPATAPHPRPLLVLPPLPTQAQLQPPAPRTPSSKSTSDPFTPLLETCPSFHVCAGEILGPDVPLTLQWDLRGSSLGWVEGAEGR